VPWENRVREAADRDGETLVTAGPMPASEVAATLERIEQVAAMVECDSTLVHLQDHPSNKEAPALQTAFVLVRKRPSEGHHLDLRVAVVGNVDAGKSTLVGVMTGPTTFLDDGRGLARSRVLRHKHEAETGRTSSIAEDQHMRLTAKGGNLATERHQKSHPTTESAETAKVVSFIDLAGHERYLRTTVYGLTAHEPDYVMVVVGANHGITRMTKEHVGMAIALNVPLFVVVTKVDLCPEAVMKETMKQLTRLLKLPGARKQPYAVRGVEELMMAVRGFGKSAITPIFTISSVDGTNVPLLRQFFNLMPSRRSWVSTDQLPAEFLIDQFFNVVGVGLVVAGTLLSGLVTLNHQLLMGPDYQGRFNPVTVRSIHHMRTAVPALLPGQTGAFVVRSKTKEHVRQFGIRKGMVLLDPALNPVATKRFTCDVLVLHSQTTMRVNYQPILYARNVRQCVRIVEMDKDVLRTGVRARVTFEFMYRVEFLQKDTKVLFTEGKTKAIGTIRDLLGE
jgi:GTPase